MVAAIKTKRRQIPKENREKVIARDGGKCNYCGTTERLTVDHIVPLKHGGSNLMSNMITSCHSCNSKKNGNRLLPIFEKRTLKKAYTANCIWGIPQDMDVTKKLVTETRSKRRAKRRVNNSNKADKRRKEVENKFIRVFGENGILYMAATKTQDETRKLVYRIKKRKVRYLSIPTGPNGQRVFILGVHDKLSRSKEIKRADAIELFVPLGENTEWGYFSGAFRSKMKING